MVRCLVVDDEPLAREGLEQYAADVPFLEVVGTAASALHALPLVQELQPDLLFLDIEMPKLSGLDFIRTLTRPPLVILTTAFQRVGRVSRSEDHQRWTRLHPDADQTTAGDPHYGLPGLRAGRL